MIVVSEMVKGYCTDGFGFRMKGLVDDLWF